MLCQGWQGIWTLRVCSFTHFNASLVGRASRCPRAKRFRFGGSELHTKKKGGESCEPQGRGDFPYSLAAEPCDWRVLERYIDIHKDSLDEDEEEEQLEAFEMARWWDCTIWILLCGSASKNCYAATPVRSKLCRSWTRLLQRMPQRPRCQDESIPKHRESWGKCWYPWDGTLNNQRHHIHLIVKFFDLPWQCLLDWG